MKKNWFLLDYRYLFACIRKILTIMRLTILFIALASFQTFAVKSVAQTQKLELKVTNSTIAQVLDQIEDESNYLFFYNNKIISLDKTVSLNLKDKTINEVLDILFEGTNINYTINNRQIILSGSESFNFSQQQKQVSGKVTDNSGQPLPGVTVLVKGTTNGTITDSEGSYTLPNVPADATLVFSFVGMKEQEVLVGNQTSISVALSEETIGLEEVVAVGYGVQKKEAITGSITSVKGEKLLKSQQPNLSNSFAGRMSGVIATTASGEPGADASRILIRGQSTIKTDNSNPLIVIDGVANRLGGLERLDPNDIESISVLKDASAAIYGAQAANGVILITTKRGLTGKPVFSFTHNQGFAQPTRVPDMADAATYAQIFNEVEYYKNPDGGLNQIYTDAEIQKYRDGSDPVNYPNTNWTDAVLKSISLQDHQNLSVRGGNESVSYFVSLGRKHQDGIYKKGVLKYDQINLRSNIDIQVNEYLKLGADISYRKEDRIFPMNNAGAIFRATYRTFPMLPIEFTDNEGNVYPSAGAEYGHNPTIIVTDIPGTDEQKHSYINTRLNFEYKLPFATDFTVKGFWAEDRSFKPRVRFAKNWIVYDAYDPGTGTYPEVKGGPVTPELTQNAENEYLQTYNISLNYLKSLGNNHISAFVAFEQNEQSKDWFEAFRRGYLSDQIPVLDMGGAAPEESSNSGNKERFTRRNYLGRVSYDRAHRYFVEAQFRYDGSSRFPDGNRYGFFPSASVGWRVSEEAWFNSEKISNLKLRTSYGLLGNDRVAPFQYLNSYSLRQAAYVLNGQPVSTFIISQLANPFITWENAKKFDIGVEMNFLDYFNMELDYFHENRTDLLIPRSGSVPLVSGIVNEYGEDNIIPDENIGEVSNQGIEVQLGFKKVINDFMIFADGNFTFNKSNVINIDDPEGIPEWQKQEGKPLGSQLLYNVIGVFRNEDEIAAYPSLPGAQPGDLIYEDVNDDKEINALDRVRESLSNVPQIVYGLNAGFTYKSIDFSMLLQGQARSVQYVLPESGTIGNYFSSWADNRWSPNNTEGTYPRVDVRTSSSVNGGLYKNNFWLYNTSFLRIKNVEFGYTLPSSITSKLRLQQARIYVNGYNLVTFSKVKDFDPEGTSESAQFYPQQRTFNVGINVKF